MPSLSDKTIFDFQTCRYGDFFLSQKDAPLTNLDTSPSVHFFIRDNLNLKTRHLFKIFLILAIIFLISSCSQATSEDINNNFLKKYGGEVEKINNIRESSQQVQTVSDCQSSFFGCEEGKDRWKEPSTMFGIENSSTAQSATIDTSKITMPKPPEEFTPNIQTLTNGQGRQLPEDMFYISYNLNNFPESYGRQKLSFDDINIPKQDAFGVRTELGEKNYQLIGNRTLQQDIDFTKQLTNKSDQEISSELIKQEKQIRRSKKAEAKNTEDEQATDDQVDEYKNNVSTKKYPTKKEDNKNSTQPLDNIINQVTGQISKTIEETTTTIKKNQ